MALARSTFLGCRVWCLEPQCRGLLLSRSTMTASVSSRQLMAQEPLEKLGFRDLMAGKSESKSQS
jgi:hypothetical protein